MEPEFKWAAAFLAVVLGEVVAIAAGAVALVHFAHLGTVASAVTAIVAMLLCFPATVVSLVIADVVGNRAEAKQRG